MAMSTEELNKNMREYANRKKPDFSHLKSKALEQGQEGRYSADNPFGYTDDERGIGHDRCDADTGSIYSKASKVVKDLSPEFLDELMEEVNNTEFFEIDYLSEVHKRHGFTDNNIISRNKYMREIQPGVWVDVYDVIEAFGVTDGGFQHALKKILACGSRGHKDEEEDRKDIHMSIKRSNEIFEHKRLEK
jgi:hypothetical protein